MLAVLTAVSAAAAVRVKKTKFIISTRIRDSNKDARRKWGTEEWAKKKR
jgi:hypothetical protein